MTDEADNRQPSTAGRANTIFKPETDPAAVQQTSGHRSRRNRRMEIVEVAKKLFAACGYHNTSVTTIIQQADVARGTFYLYFPTKRAVFDAILSLALEELSRHIRIIQTDGDAAAPREQVHDILTNVLNFLWRDRPLTTLLLNHGLTPDAESAERVEAFYTMIRQMIESSLVRGMAMDLVRPCSAALAAAGVFGATKGIIGYLLESESAKQSIPAIADEIVEFVLFGVVNPLKWRI